MTLVGHMLTRTRWGSRVLGSEVLDLSIGIDLDHPDSPTRDGAARGGYLSRLSWSVGAALTKRDAASPRLTVGAGSRMGLDATAKARHDAGLGNDHLTGLI